MSSDIDDEWPQSPSGMIHSYVNIVDGETLEGEAKPALPERRREKHKSGGERGRGQRKSRSKDREKSRDGMSDYERIKEREKELERIHRRSRELMLSPHSRESSQERVGKSGKILDHHHRMSAGPHFSHPPPPCHPPPPLAAAQTLHRYKSSSPCGSDLSKHGMSLKKRVQSPNRRDYKDFSVQNGREFRTPVRGGPRYSEDEEDSGADSMNEFVSSKSNHSCRGWTAPSSGRRHMQHPQSMALVPYDSQPHHQHGSNACHSCCSPCQQTYMYSPQNMQLALPSSIEDRLQALEGDKDQLQIQVTVLSDHIEKQTDKISDLEINLDTKKEALKKTEDVLQREILNKSSLETQKLELLTEITDLRLKQTTYERENVELRKRLQRTLHLSDSSLDTRSLPREYRDGSQPPPSVFRPVNFLDKQRSEKEMTPNRGETSKSFFRRSGSLRGSSRTDVKEKQKMKERDKSEEMGKQVPDCLMVPLVDPGGQHSHQTPIATRPKGLKKILSKMRRANSGHIPQEGEGELGGKCEGRDQYRASGGWSEVQRQVDCDLAFGEWTTDIICSWFDTLGLYMYSNEVKRCIKSGEQLASFTNTDLEFKLGIKNPLHRKKVQLAILARQEAEETEDPAGLLDHQWVTRWLDDVGLPQYKDAFLEARVDGRVLNFLTVEDLFILKVTNQLHHFSIKRGIQVLRENNFEPSCLKRRGVPGERDSQIVHSDVVFWTNHRVMEWLRHVDLSEYAPNLRGSGVHGALLVKEKRFTAELMAGLLSIPVSKSLLRRHLSLHFKDLLGPDVIQTKRNAESEPNFTPLTPTTKAKQPKKGQFTLKRKKSKSELDFEDMVCPLSSQ